MAAGSVLVPLAVCEDCYLSEHAHWEPESMDETGCLAMRLIGIDVPEKVNTGDVEVCCECGSITVSGIYEFKDPDKVCFARDDNDDPPQFEMDLP